MTSTSGSSRYGKLLGLVAFLFFPLFSCLNQDEKVERVFSFVSSFDTLSKFDSVQITVKDPAGGAVDTLFAGKVTDKSQLAELPAPHFSGGEAIITFIGTTGGKTTYKVERNFDGATLSTNGTHILLTPYASISLKAKTVPLRILEGETADLPQAEISPDSLFDKTLLWSCSDGTVCEIDSGRVRGLDAGEAELTARLASDTSKQAGVHVVVVSRAAIPQRIELTPDTLDLAAGGSPKKFSAKVVPTSAAQDLIWESSDSLTASVTPGGEVTGLKPGRVRIRATSAVDARVFASAGVGVTAAVSVTAVKFDADSMEVYAQGAGETVPVRVLPPEAGQEVDLTVDDTLVASVSGGRIMGLKAGNTKVTARSKADTSKSSSLKLAVLPSRAIDSVVIKRDKVKLYFGGPADTLSAVVHAADSSDTTGKVLWSSLDPDTVSVDAATGVIGALAPGRAHIVAVSRADGTRRDTALVTVVKDVPLLSVGADTVIGVGGSVKVIPVVTQEYGGVAEFKWDMDGDGAWDSSASALREVTRMYPSSDTLVAHFYVRDAEGNEREASKRIKVVKGSVVKIVKPKNLSYTNKTFLDSVLWTVDGKIQDTYTTQSLDREGPDTIVRTYTDGQGQSFSDSVVVIRDTQAPGKPLQVSAAWSNSANPVWAWKGGGGGASRYRYRAETEVTAGDPEVGDSSYDSPTLSEGQHSLYVQERDSAGNWSASARLSVKVDLTRPSAPASAPDHKVLVNGARPLFKWVSTANGAGGAAGRYRVAFDTSKAATAVDSLSFVPASDLKEGFDTLYVAESDSAGNWSLWTRIAVHVDLTPPAPPAVTTPDTLPVGKLWVSFAWSGGGGGIGTYRYKLDDSTLAGAAENQNLAYNDSTKKVAEGRHTLYVQERDSAGNWSKAGKRSVVLALNRILPVTGLPAAALYLYTLAIGPDDRPIVALSQGSSISFLKFNGASWDSWAKSLPAGSVQSVFLGFDSSGVAYAAYTSDFANAENDSGYCYRLTGGSWDLVAKDILGVNTRFALDAKGNMFEISDFRGTGGSAAGFGAKYVSGGKWLSFPSICCTDSYALSIAVTPAGVPYVAYHYYSGATNGGLLVARWANNSWNTMTPQLATYPSACALASGGDGSMYAVVVDNSTYATQIQKTTGTTWSPVLSSLDKPVNIQAAASPAGPPLLLEGFYADATHADYYGGGVKNGAILTTSSRKSFSRTQTRPALAVDRNGVGFTLYPNTGGSPEVMQLSFEP
jgi:uncharacterized protein YjdB